MQIVAACRVHIDKTRSVDMSKSIWLFHRVLHLIFNRHDNERPERLILPTLAVTSAGLGNRPPFAEPSRARTPSATGECTS